MSFNITNLKKKSVESDASKNSVHYAKKLVIGSDFFSVMKFFNLKKECNGEVTLMGDKAISIEQLKNEISREVRRVRTEEEMLLLKEKFPNLEFNLIESSPKFYKDGEIKIFGEKAKPMEIYPGEEHFISESYFCDFTKILSEDEWTELENSLKTHYFEKKILEIVRVNNDDLAEPRNFSLKTGDEMTFNIEDIYYYGDIQELLNMFPNKDDLGDETVNYFSSYSVKSALKLSFVLKNNFETDPATFLFPRSQTHEWGHYIFEFNQTEKSLNAVIIIHEEDYNEEDLAKKVRHFKTTLKRNYSDFEENIIKETIIFDKEYYKINPKNLKEKVTNLHLDSFLNNQLSYESFLLKPFFSL